METSAADFCAFTESLDHELVVLGQQRERLASVAVYKSGSGRYAAKLESCGVDLQLCFDDKQRCSGWSAARSARVSFIHVRRHVHRYPNHLYVEFPAASPTAGIATYTMILSAHCASRPRRSFRPPRRRCAHSGGSFADVAHPEPSVAPRPAQKMPDGLAVPISHRTLRTFHNWLAGEMSQNYRDAPSTREQRYLTER